MRTRLCISALGLLMLTAMPAGCANGPEPPPRAVWPPADAALAMNRDAQVFIPQMDDLTRTLRVAVVYNDTHIQVRYEFATEHPSWYHDYLVYRDGRWERLGEGAAGPAPLGLQEDRIAMMLDDGLVEGFAEYGGYVTMHPGVSSRSDQAPEATNKFIPPSRRGELDADLWRRTRSAEQLDRLRDEGVFIHTWQWRAHRSNPVGHADPGYVLDARNSAEGRGMYATNWDGDSRQPLFMFDPQVSGHHALDERTLLDRGYGQDDPYYLYDRTALPFDPEHDWREGDVLPRRYLRDPSDSRASLKAQGRWEDGSWRVRVTRTLEAPNPRDSKAIEPGETYHVAFAVHSEATQARWHYVSMPLTLGLDVEADVTAQYTEGDLDEASAQWHEVPLFYSGQVYLAWLKDNGHPVHQRFADARDHPMSPARIQALAEALVQHELAWLRRQGVEVSDRH